MPSVSLQLQTAEIYPPPRPSLFILLHPPCSPFPVLLFLLVPTLHHLQKEFVSPSLRIAGNASAMLRHLELLYFENPIFQSGNVGGKETSKEESSSLQEGGSLSDSGISDSGSELELSERERRLAVLRRLTRNLENQLEPGSETLAALWKRVQEVEAELRVLQEQCRRLIVRTATSVEARALKRAASGQATTFLDKRRRSSIEPMREATREASREEGKCSEAEEPAEEPTEELAEEEGRHELWKEERGKDRACSPLWLGRNVIEDSSGWRKRASADSGDPDREPGIPRSWIWRILRAALPFQLALVVLLCAACLLEPHCCEAINGLDLSLTPQLRYVRGPPPV